MVRKLVKINRNKYKREIIRKAEELDRLLKNIHHYVSKGNTEQAIVELFKWKEHATVDYIAKKLNISEFEVENTINNMKTLGDCDVIIIE